MTAAGQASWRVMRMASSGAFALTCALKMPDIVVRVSVAFSTCHGYGPLIIFREA